MSFRTRPAVLPLPNDQWAFAGPLVWLTDAEDVVVPNGFVMNGASIPKAFWSTIGHPMRTGFVYPAGVHDYECTVRTAPSAEVHRRFRDMLKAEGVGRVRRHLMYWAVAAFGPSWTLTP